MKQTWKKGVVVFLAAVLLAMCAGLSAAAIPGSTPVVLTCTNIPLNIDNEYIGSGIIVNSVIYVPLLSFAELMLGKTCEVVWNQDTGTASINTQDFDLTLTMGQDYMTVNGRYIYFEDGVYNINGTILVPIRELSRVFALKLALDREEWILHIDASDSRIFEHGGDFYDQDELYWLSHVIHAEAGNQPLKGKIGVGNVIMNRIADSSGLFADSIRDVIFQTGQFNVVNNGTIYMTPSEESVVAAKLCMEGYNTVGESRWFVNPSYGTAGWFDRNATYVTRIADHVFYS